MKKHLLRILWVLNQLGIDPLQFLGALKGMAPYFRDLREFRKSYRGTLIVQPCLHDRDQEGGVTNSEYFWQDLLVARLIYEAMPAKHVDVGSRVDGFVAHVASFREIEVFDVRPITGVIPRVTFREADMMNLDSLSIDIEEGGYCDSLSCLHALEHFGLGRYGDPVDLDGYRKGIVNMAKLIRPGGTFYLSTPIGKERVEFNANWVFDPRTIIAIAESVGLELASLKTFGAGCGIRQSEIHDQALNQLAQQNYNLGIFVFIRIVC